MTRSTALFTVLLVLASASAAVAANIPNSSFEDSPAGTWTTTIASWTLVPPVSVPPSNYRAGVFFSFDGYTATDKTAFSIITHRNQGSQGLISSDIVLASYDKTLEFDYLYVTKNAPGSTIHVDPFTVHLFDAGTDTELASWTVSDTNDSNLALGVISSVPWAGSGSNQNTYDTDWQTFTVSIQDYVSNTVYLEFRQVDSAQQGGGTGFFLDRVSITPEPGTFLLFGVGAIGLMLFGKRRMRRGK
jgi:hypothetical protein